MEDDCDGPVHLEQRQVELSLPVAERLANLTINADYKGPDVLLNATEKEWALRECELQAWSDGVRFGGAERPSFRPVGLRYVMGRIIFP